MATQPNPFTPEQEQQIQQAFASLDERLGVTELDVAAGHQALMAEIARVTPPKPQRSTLEPQQQDWVSRWSPWALLGAGVTAGVALMIGVNVGFVGSQDGSSITLATGNSLEAAQQLADAQGRLLKEEAGGPGASSSRVVAGGASGASSALTSGGKGAGQLTKVLVAKGSPLGLMELVRRADNARLGLMITHTPGGETSVMVMNLQADKASHRSIKRIAGVAQDYSGSIEFIFLE